MPAIAHLAPAQAIALPVPAPPTLYGAVNLGMPSHPDHLQHGITARTLPSLLPPRPGYDVVSVKPLASSSTWPSTQEISRSTEGLKRRSAWKKFLKGAAKVVSMVLRSKIPAQPARATREGAFHVRLRVGPDRDHASNILRPIVEHRNGRSVPVSWSALKPGAAPSHNADLITARAAAETHTADLKPRNLLGDASWVLMGGNMLGNLMKKGKLF